MKFPITLLIIGIFLFIKNKDEITSFMKLQDSKVVSMILILSLFVLIYICRQNVEGLITCNPTIGQMCPPGDIHCPPSGVCPSGGGGEPDHPPPDNIPQPSGICGKLDPQTCTFFSGPGNFGGNCVDKTSPNNSCQPKNKDECEKLARDNGNFEWCNNGPYKSELTNTNKYNVEVWNNTDKPIFVLVNVKEPGYNDDFEEYWEPHIFDIGANNEMMWEESLKGPGEITTSTKKTADHFVYNLNPYQSLRFKSGTGYIREWISGNISVVSNNKNLDTTGLTKLEYTIKPHDNISADISAVDGFNIDVDFRYYNGNGTNFDDTHKLTCTILDKAKGKYNTTDNRIYLPTVDEMGGEAKQFQETIISDGDKCGIENNCSGCPTGENTCKEDASLSSGCDLFEKQKKWGCYRFWYDKDNNPKAAKWLDLFDDECPIYGWAYDEVELKGKTPPTRFGDTKFNHYLNVCPEGGQQVCNDYDDDLLSQCAEGNKTEEECRELGEGKTYLVKKSRDLPKSIININDQTLISFKINKIL